jgi:glycine oxidase
MRVIETLVIGQGLAGTAVAWSLYGRGNDFFIVDDGALSSSSRVAAGLVTPVTGQRAANCWEWYQASRLANAHYAKVERCTGRSFYRHQAAVRLYQNSEEGARLLARFGISSNPLIDEYSDCERERDSTFYRNDHGGFRMPNAYRLETARYLDASRDFFEKADRFRSTSLNLDQDISFTTNGILLPKLDLLVKHIILAQGHASLHSRWFPSVPISLVQGDILTIEVPTLVEERTMHCGVWLVPKDRSSIDERHLFLVGATYRREHFDGLPSSKGRQELEEKLRDWLKVPFAVVDHRAGIRPGSFDQKPLLGRSASDPRICILNGLGGKGALYAPWMAEMLVSFLLDHQQIPAELLWNRREK